MSSTVTTATVSSVTAAITVEGLGQMLVLAAIVLLGVALLAKEVFSVSESRLDRMVSRGLDIGLAPLLSVFLLVIVLNAISFVQGY